MEINYSIIIPHYNIPDLLMRCLKSIPVREDVQVIVVDDCSPDADTYLDRYPELSRPYLEFYSTEKGGSAGRARNVGLRHARGRWLIFADADDFFNLCFEDILEKYKNSDAEMIVFNANSVDEDYVSADRTAHLNRMVDEYQSKENPDTKMLRYAFGEPWCKIIKRSVIAENNIWFEETPIHNDTLFSYLVGFKVASLAVDRRAGYCVLSRLGSVSRQQSEECLLTRMEVFSKKNRFMERNSIDYFDPLFWLSLDQARSNVDLDVWEKCCAIAGQYGYDMVFIDSHYSKLDEARRREARYWKRRRIIELVKRIAHI